MGNDLIAALHCVSLTRTSKGCESTELKLAHQSSWWALKMDDAQVIKMSCFLQLLCGMMSLLGRCQDMSKSYGLRCVIH